jgi:uncharacterized protein YgiM (DUF1202 family)
MKRYVQSRRDMLRTLVGAGVATLAAPVLTQSVSSASARSGGWQQGDRVMVNVDLLNLRAAAGLDEEILATYAFGTRATIVSETGVEADGYMWYGVKTDIDGAYGWWVGAFLTSEADEVPSDTFEVVDGPLNLRTDPYTESEIVRALETGETGVVIDPEFLPNQGYLWINVRVDDSDASEGWIASEYVQFT